MPSFLPILIPGRTEPVNVPCSLPDSWTFDVFLPDRGVRKVAVFWKSSDPRKVEVCETALANPETDPSLYLSDPYEVDEDEDQRMQDAAGDVLVNVLQRLAINSRTRQPSGHHVVTGPIASAFLAECEAFEAQLAACHAMPRAAGQVLGFADPREGGVSVAQVLLSRYTDWCVDEACKAQDAKALKESMDHLSSRPCEGAPGSEAGGSDRAMAGRVLGEETPEERAAFSRWMWEAP